MSARRVVSTLLFTEPKPEGLLYGVIINWVMDLPDGRKYRGSTMAKYKSIETATARLAWIANGLHNNPHRRANKEDFGMMTYVTTHKDIESRVTSLVSVKGP
jgi:hypothetical protein